MYLFTGIEHSKLQNIFLVLWDFVDINALDQKVYIYIYIYIYNIYTYLGFLNALSLTLFDKQTIIIPLNEKIAGFTHLKPKDY